MALKGGRQNIADEPRPFSNGYYGDYIGTTFVPYNPLVAIGGTVQSYPLSAWTDSRAGCQKSGIDQGQYDHHVQATLW